MVLESDSTKRWLLISACLALALPRAQGGPLADAHVPLAARELPSISEKPAHDRLQLAIGLPLRDEAGLNALMNEVSDPRSPNFRKYLTPEQFTDRFGPTEDQYQSVIHFAEAHGLTVTALHPNRLLVDVTGNVANIEQAFHVKLRNYRHPVEGRTFFAPDTEPIVDGAVPIVHVAGLSDYWIPHPHSRIRPLNVTMNNVSPKTGSGPTGTFVGNDFRAAYVPGVSLNGAGQTVGLLEFDGYNPNDIVAYERTAGFGNVPLETVLVDGFSGRPGTNNSEVCLDIELAIAMAPGLSKVIVYEAPNSSPWEDILSQMANENRARQISCSWGGGPPSSAAEAIFRQMAAQGQTFFNATGDNDAYTGQVPFPSDSPNIVQVGGTSLGTLTPGGAWYSETVWNWGGGDGSSGGFSDYYAIPSWQQTVSMATNQGSTTFRNLPDVALTAENIYTVADNGRAENSAGTSCAAPLWAGFTALVNQQAANNGQPAVGFINPALYLLGTSKNYSLLFHDIIAGNNITSQSNGRFSAVTGFDLCTGWGTPQALLITALASPNNAITTYRITVSAAPPNGGSVTGGAVYLAGASVTVTANPNPAFAFAGWTENGNVVSTSVSYSFTATDDRDLVANFTQTTTLYSIAVSASPANLGSVSGGGTFLAGSQHAVYALTTKRRYVFLNWTENGVVVSTSQYYSFTLDSDRNLVAQFGPKRRSRRR